MPDDLINLAVAVAADIAIAKAAKRRRWVRVLNAIGSILFIGFIIGLAYITFRYS